MPQILHVNTSDAIGGAASIAMALHRACLNSGFQSKMLVGVKHTDDPTVNQIEQDAHKSVYTRTFLKAARNLQRFDRTFKGAYRLRKTIEFAAEPKRHFAIRRGFEDFQFPGTWHLLNGNRPDLVHAHNLHGGYFDLNALSWLSQTLPVVLTLHDAWLLSGHCSHSLDCEKWQTGCGNCPDLTLYPATPRDQTSRNWIRKKNILAGCRLHVATPSQWLMKRISESILAPAIEDSKIIPNGVDITKFHPGKKAPARAELGIPQDRKVFLTVGNQTASNPFKDYETLRKAFQILANRKRDLKLLLIVLGDQSATETFHESEIRFVPYQLDVLRVILWYQTADLYVHAANADTFPTTVLEALACGLPVIATAVGGVPEQVLTENRATGILTPPRDASAMAAAMERLILDDGLRNRMGERAREDAVTRFDAARQNEQYINWYREILETSKSTSASRLL